jgi:threonyl-tRNA synthetase
MSDQPPIEGDAAEQLPLLARLSQQLPFAAGFQNNRVPEEEARARRLHRLRHSAAHVMAEAVLQMFPEAKFGAGPATEHGFFYDIELPRPLTPADLDEIERRMKKIAKRGWPFQTVEVPLDQARMLFGGADQPYKLEILHKIEATQGAQTATLYRQNQFVDLCAGPHLSSTGKLKFFKLLRTSGAYWRGDANNPMLQRIYGTAWETQEDLDAYLHFLEEAKKRNHKRLGAELDLFHFHPEAPGAAFWTPRGYAVVQALQAYWRELGARRGYQEIWNPMLYKRDLYIRSGHYAHYKEDMFIFKHEHEDTEYCLKPMNCPDTFLYYTSKKRSFRELPLRIAEGGILHRNEMAGALNGLFRVRQFMQDDAHIFVTPEQVEAEIFEVLDIVREVYSLFDLSYSFTLSTRNPEKFMGDVATWDRAEADLKAALDKGGFAYTVDAGGGAFYGPKIDIKIDDCLGRKWQCATVQLDFQQPLNFDMKYTASDNTAQRPIVIHRAIFGSFERFLGVLLEHTAGALPTWLSPLQAVVVPISDKSADYAWTVCKHLQALGIRAEVDDRTEKMQYKIREAELRKTPFMLVVGEKEAAEGLVSLRTYREGQQSPAAYTEVASQIAARIASRQFDVEVKPLRTFDDADAESAATDDEY